jgi:GNAT superfamily N-acetyltransferase
VQDMTVREATEEDVRTIMELSTALFQEDAGQRDPFMNLNWPREEGEAYYTGITLGQDSVCFVAEVDGSVVGFLTGYVREPDSMRPVPLAELESMFVERGFRGQQVGTHLANSFLAWCWEKGTQRVSVTAYAANVGAVAFYRRLGFEPRNLTLELGLGAQEEER